MFPKAYFPAGYFVKSYFPGSPSAAGSPSGGGGSGGGGAPDYFTEEWVEPARRKRRQPMPYWLRYRGYY